uniref:Uncharacterized protein n=1 Tax=Romanomermis culicivorax TaxID=13658 RepID=A0A915HI46_ROMCU
MKARKERKEKERGNNSLPKSITGEFNNLTILLYLASSAVKISTIFPRLVVVSLENSANLGYRALEAGDFWLEL